MRVPEKVLQSRPVSWARAWAGRVPGATRRVRDRYDHLSQTAAWKKGRPIALTAVIVLCLFHLGWQSLNFVSFYHPLNDSGIFAAGGLHILEGKALYRDFWDHKPPVIHLLNALAMGVGERSIMSVRGMERLFAAAGLLLVFFLLYGAFRSRVAAVLGAVVYQFHFYNNAVFEYGNLSEEYAAVFMLGAVLATWWAREKRGGASWVLSGVSGLLFSLAAFTKEPFLFASFPWFIYLVLRREEGWRGALCRATAFVAGSIIPAVLISLYLLSKGAFGDWLDVLSFNINNTAASRAGAAAQQGLLAKAHDNLGRASTALFSQSVTGRILFGMGLCALGWAGFVRRARYFPVALFFAYLANYHGSQLSARNFGHYYMQLAPDFALIAAMGFAFAIWLAGQSRTRGALLLIPLGVSLFVWDYEAVSDYVTRVKRPFQHPRPEIINSFVNANSEPDDTIWVQHQAISRYYIGTGRLSATRFAYAPSHLFIDTRDSTRQEKIDLLKAELEAAPPKFIIDWPRYCAYSRTLSVWNWITANYEKTAIANNEIELYVHRAPENQHIWEFDPAQDYNRKYSAVNFAAGNWRLDDEAIHTMRRQMRPMVFHTIPEAARSVEAVEAERYENRLERNHRGGSSYASGGYLVAGSFGDSRDHELRYTIHLDRDLPSGWFTARYATPEEGAAYTVQITNRDVGTLTLKSTGQWGREGFSEARMRVEGLKAGLHSLVIKSNGVPVDFDLFYFSAR